ncbi:CONTINUOUS VASCULAR RING protein [Actinidia rufa]|uniref:CONTINUOUS VASCULAR RING protein n=1 Tax=Actinidia rufa TaxID=165716 RepID=A0A7J0FD45_9ERIC|nr:CONTINUOUS VASCULAR RING protein [Actinidia rufa]
MGDEKSSMVMGSRDRELLIPVADASTSADDVDAKPFSSASSSHHSGREDFWN